jgi:toxin ParE1/3/4
MNSYHFTPEADQDLNDIYDFIALRSAAAAARVIQSLHRACRQLAQFPGIGSACDDLQAGMFAFVSGKYVIFYRPVGNDVQIIRISHGARDVSSLFPQP